jgi:hypothetical protein
VVGSSHVHPSYFGECCRRVGHGLHSAPPLCLFFLFFLKSFSELVLAPCGLLALFFLDFSSRLVPVALGCCWLSPSLCLTSRVVRFPLPRLHISPFRLVAVAPGRCWLSSSRCVLFPRCCIRLRFLVTMHLPGPALAHPHRCPHRARRRGSRSGVGPLAPPRLWLWPILPLCAPVVTPVDVRLGPAAAMAVKVPVGYARWVGVWARAWEGCAA